jgi:hypothetical protein
VLRGSVTNAASFPANDLSYAWTQVSGKTVTLTGVNSPSATFIAPSATPSAIATLSFNLTVHSTAQTSEGAGTVPVTVDPSIKDQVTITSYTWTNQQGGTLTASAESNVVDGSATLSLFFNDPSLPTGAQTMTSSGGGKFTFNKRSTKKPVNGITVNSNLGGTSTKSTTTS